MKDATDEPDLSVRKQGKQPESRSQPVSMPVPVFPQQPPVPPMQTLSQQPTNQGIGVPIGQSYQFQAAPQQFTAAAFTNEERPKRKGKKRVNKKVES